MSIGDLPDPAIVEILDALVARNYEAAAGGSSTSAELFRQAVAQYGHRLLPMDAAAWDKVVVYRVASDTVEKYVTNVTIPDDDGYNDLTLTIETIVGANGVVESRAVDLHVL